MHLALDLFLARVQQRYHNLPALIFEDAELRELLTPLLRADFTLVETYQCPAPTSLPCPLIALGGADDPWATPAELRAWQALTTADFVLHLFPGGHFYLNEQVQSLLATIANYLV